MCRSTLVAGWSRIRDQDCCRDHHRDRISEAVMTPGEMYAALFLSGLAWVAGYAVACALWPFAACRRCKGSGKRRSPSGRAYGRCRKCRGKGERVRTGRRVFVALSVLKKDAS